LCGSVRAAAKALSPSFSITSFDHQGKNEVEKIMTVRMEPEVHRMLAERAKEVGASFSRYLIECGLFEWYQRHGILTPEDREALLFLAFQVTKVATNLNQIARRSKLTSGIINPGHLEAVTVELKEVTGLLKSLLGEV